MILIFSYGRCDEFTLPLSTVYIFDTIFNTITFLIVCSHYTNIWSEPKYKKFDIQSYKIVSMFVVIVSSCTRASHGFLLNLKIRYNRLQVRQN